MLLLEDMRYSTQNRVCCGKEGCRIQPGDDNNEKTEPINECTECGKLSHESYSMSNEEQFRCLHCVPRKILPKIQIQQDQFSVFMTERINRFCESLKIGRNQEVVVVSFTNRKEVDLVEDRPQHLKKEFRKLYGKAPTEYTERVIYVFQDTDVLFFSMVAHEYPNHNGNSYCLIDTLDSIPFFDVHRRLPVGRGAVYHVIILAYFDYMRSIGFQKGHIWADAPIQGDDAETMRRRSRSKSATPREISTIFV